ncbi:MAG: cell division protein ZapA [candidate division NC10 bacterium]|nr:cell division protein ZapA [candidate division NC10 bacterium]
MSDQGDLVHVEIFGERYTLRGLGGEDSAYTRRVAHYVDQQIHEVAGGTAVLSIKVAVLASLNIADAFLKLEERVKKEETAAAAKVHELEAELDEVIKRKPLIGGAQK